MNNNNNQVCSLTAKHCVPCEGGIPPLTLDEYTKLLLETPGFEVSNETLLQRDFKFKNFKEALVFVNQVGEIAEEQGHHPDISLHNWNKVKIVLTTHAIKGLSENDFILAAKINEIFV